MLNLWLYTTELSFVAVILSLYRLESKPSLQAFFESVPGWVCLGAVLAVGVGVLCVVRTIRRVPRALQKPQRLALAVHVFTLVLICVASEGTIRYLSVETQEGPRFARQLLYPRQWSEVVRKHRVVIAAMADGSPYVVHDPYLGWTLAHDRKDSTGLYATSIEGMRASEAGVSFADSLMRLTGRASIAPQVRIAFVGDSMTFGSEVRCEESFPHILQERLGAPVQILNFAVPGYSAAQAWQRYKNDVRAWKPDIVIMGVTSRQLLRVMNVYNFLISPQGVQFPFARPRMIVDGDSLKTINLPVPAPAEVFSSPTISALPYLDQDRFYARLEWERSGGWALLQWSYLFRLVTSVRPPTEPLPAHFSDAALGTLTRRVMREFVADVRRDGATPLIVHLPYREELSTAHRTALRVMPLGSALLNQVGEPFVDMIPCLIEAQVLDAYAPGDHYTQPAHSALARCLEPIVQTHFAETKKAAAQ